MRKIANGEDYTVTPTIEDATVLTDLTQVILKLLELFGFLLSNTRVYTLYEQGVRKTTIHCTAPAIIPCGMNRSLIEARY